MTDLAPLVADLTDAIRHTDDDAIAQAQKNLASVPLTDPRFVTNDRGRIMLSDSESRRVARVFSGKSSRDDTAPALKGQFRRAPDDQWLAVIIHDHDRIDDRLVRIRKKNGSSEMHRIRRVVRSYPARDEVDLLEVWCELEH